MAPFLWALIIGTFIPLVTALVTKWHAPAHLRAILTAGLSAAAGALTGGLASNTIDGQHWQYIVATAFAGWSAAVVADFGLWRSTGAAPALAWRTRKFGLSLGGTPDLFFADLSNYNSPVDLVAYRAAYDVVAEQVNWGTLITDPNGRMQQIRSLNFDLVIWYMGLVATQDIATQVQVFVNTLGGLLPNEAIVIDWEETPGSGTPTVAQRDQAANLLATHYGWSVVWVGIYGSASMLGASPPLGWAWVASYETGEPGIAHILWQFTNGVYVSNPYGPINFPGVGESDASVFHGSIAQLIALVCPSSTPVPPIPPEALMAGVSEAIQTPDKTWHRFSIFFGGLVHYWLLAGAPAYSNENVAKIADPTGPVGNIAFDMDQVPEVQLVGGQLSVAAVNTSRIPFDFRQTFGTAAWGAMQVLIPASSAELLAYGHPEPEKAYAEMAAIVARINELPPAVPVAA